MAVQLPLRSLPRLLWLRPEHPLPLLFCLASEQHCSHLSAVTPLLVCLSWLTTLKTSLELNKQRKHFKYASGKTTTQRAVSKGLQNPARLGTSRPRTEVKGDPRQYISELLTNGATAIEAAHYPGMYGCTGSGARQRLGSNPSDVNG